MQYMCSSYHHRCMSQFISHIHDWLYFPQDSSSCLLEQLVFFMNGKYQQPGGTQGDSYIFVLRVLKVHDNPNKLWIYHGVNFYAGQDLCVGFVCKSELHCTCIHVRCDYRTEYLVLFSPSLLHNHLITQQQLARQIKLGNLAMDVLV